MAQVALGTADAHVGNWVNRTIDEFAAEVITFTDLFESASGGTNDDDAFARSDDSPAASPYVMKLAEILDPEDDTGHSIPYRAKSEASPVEQIDLTVELRQGYVSEGSPGTLIDSEVQVDLPNVFTDFVFSIPDASSITDYTDLYIRFVANKV